MTKLTAPSPQKMNSNKTGLWTRLLIIFISIPVILLLATPAAIKQGLQHWLSEQTQREVSIAEVKLNLINGKLSLRQLQIPHADSPETVQAPSSATSLEYASVTIDWQALFNKKLVIKEVILSHAKIAIERTGKQLQIAGIPLPTTEATAPETTRSESPQHTSISTPAITIESITLEAIKFDYYSGEIDTHFEITSATVKDISTISGAAIPVALTMGVDKGRIHYQGELLSLDEAPAFKGKLTITDLNLAPFVALAPQSDFIANSATLSLQSTLAGTLPADAPPSIELSGNATLSEIDVVSTLHRDTFVKTAVIELNKINLDYPKTISIDEVVASDLETALFRNRNGHLFASQTTPAPQRAVSTKSTARQGDAPPPAFSVNSLLLQGNSSLAFKDATVEPAFNLQLRSLALNVGRIDSSHKEAETPISFSADINGNGALKLTGHVSPLRDDITLQIDSSLTGLELPSVSPYTEKYIGYQLRRGRLAAETELTIANGQLNADNRLTLTKLSIKESDHAKAQGLIDQLEMPLDSALDLLRDGHDNIIFDLPIDGAIDDPQFKLDGVIKLALGKGVKMAAMKYLTNALQPLGTLLLAKDIVGRITRLRFQPLTFAPGSAELNDHSQAYLAKIGELLKQRPKLTITLCGVATGDDLAALSKSDKPAEQRVHALARARADNTRSYLTTQQEIAESQLFECSPEVTDDTGKAGELVEGVEITL